MLLNFLIQEESKEIVGVIESTNQEVLQKSPTAITNNAVIVFLILFIFFVIIVYLFKKFFKK